MFKAQGKVFLVGIAAIMLVVAAAPFAEVAAQEPTAEAELMLELINQERGQRGLETLKFDGQLAAVAEEHAHDMINRDYFAHHCPGGVSPADRVRNAEVPFGIMGENLAGNTDVRHAHGMLMDSPGHRDNILHQRFQRVGVSIVDGGRYGKMMVMKFADGQPAQDERASAAKNAAEASSSGGPSVVIDGNRLDESPKLVNGRAMVPLRGVFEAMDATVEWDDGTSTITALRGGTRVELTIGQSAMLVDGQQVELDVPGSIEDGRTLVPLRAVSQALGVDVDWDGDTRTVTITSR